MIIGCKEKGFSQMVRGRLFQSNAVVNHKNLKLELWVGIAENTQSVSQLSSKIE